MHQNFVRFISENGVRLSHTFLHTSHAGLPISSLTPHPPLFFDYLDLDLDLDPDPDLDPDLDHDHDHHLDNDLDNDLDPDLDPDPDLNLDPDLDHDFDLDLDHDPNHCCLSHLYLIASAAAMSPCSSSQSA